MVCLYPAQVHCSTFAAALSSNCVKASPDEWRQTAATKRAPTTVYVSLAGCAYPCTHGSWNNVANDLLKYGPIFPIEFGGLCIFCLWISERSNLLGLSERRRPSEFCQAFRGWLGFHPIQRIQFMPSKPDLTANFRYPIGPCWRLLFYRRSNLWLR